MPVEAAAQPQRAVAHAPAPARSPPRRRVQQAAARTPVYAHLPKSVVARVHCDARPDIVCGVSVTPRSTAGALREALLAKLRRAAVPLPPASHRVLCGVHSQRVFADAARLYPVCVASSGAVEREFVLRCVSVGAYAPVPPPTASRVSVAVDARTHVPDAFAACSASAVGDSTDSDETAASATSDEGAPVVVPLRTATHYCDASALLVQMKRRRAPA